jgi:hypothetical protein
MIGPTPIGLDLISSASRIPGEDSSTAMTSTNDVFLQQQQVDDESAAAPGDWEWLE